MPRPKLSDILQNDHGEQLAKAWTETAPAEDFGPLPAGDYVADIISGELFTSRSKQTPGYKITFVVAEGQWVGRRLWHDVWLTPAAMPMAKRDLGKLGVTALEQLERPLPAVLRCRVKIALRKSDDGTQSNHVRSFEVVEVLAPDPFAPTDEPSEEHDTAVTDADSADPSDDQQPAAAHQE